MAYLSLYRKWRPQRFRDVVGQTHVVRTVTNALETGRASHAYLFAGPRGTGKTTLARLLAKGLNCDEGPTGEPCGQCDNCVRIAAGHSVDVIEIDGASNRGIDEIREVRERVKFAPASGRYKVYIIDEVHMLTQEAFNALLKVLEEPPRHVVFVFATTEPHRIPATIVSRCQKFDFHPFTASEIASQLKAVAQGEGVEIDDGAVHLIARHSDGGMRDALGYLDQCIAFASGQVTEGLVAQALGVVEREFLDRLASALLASDVGQSLILIKEVVDSGRDVRQFARDAVHYFRDLMLLKAAPDNERLVSLTAQQKESAKALADAIAMPRLLRIIDSLGRAEADMRWAQSAQLPLEMALIELAQEKQEQGSPALAELEERIARLEAAAQAGVRVMSDARKVKAGDTLESGPTPPPTAPAQRAASTPPTPSAPPPTATRRPKSQGKLQGKLQGTPQRAAAGGSFLEQAKEHWPAFLDSLRAARQVQLEAFLREGTPGDFEDGALVVYFSPNHQFHYANIEQEKNRSMVEQAARRFFGREVRIKPVLGEAPAMVPQSSGQRPAAAADGGDAEKNDDVDKPSVADGTSADDAAFDEPILRAALKLFGGTITKVERKENESS